MCMQPLHTLRERKITKCFPAKELFLNIYYRSCWQWSDSLLVASWTYTNNHLCHSFMYYHVIWWNADVLSFTDCWFESSILNQNILNGLLSFWRVWYDSKMNIAMDLYLPKRILVRSNEFLRTIRNDSGFKMYLSSSVFRELVIANRRSRLYYILLPNTI